MVVECSEFIGNLSRTSFSVDCCIEMNIFRAFCQQENTQEVAAPGLSIAVRRRTRTQSSLSLFFPVVIPFRLCKIIQTKGRCVSARKSTILPHVFAHGIPAVSLQPVLPAAVPPLCRPSLQTARDRKILRKPPHCPTSTLYVTCPPRNGD